MYGNSVIVMEKYFNKVKINLLIVNTDLELREYLNMYRECSNFNLSKLDRHMYFNLNKEARLRNLPPKLDKV